MSLLVRRAAVVNAPGGPQGTFDLAIEDGRIAAMEPELAPAAADTVLDAAGRLVVPGVVDAHVHLSGRFGRAIGYRMLVRAGVTCALDLAGDPGDMLRDLPGAGCGLTTGVLVPVVPGENVGGPDPSRAEIDALLDRSLAAGALGLKAIGGHYPITPAALDRVLAACADRGAHCAVHAGSTETGSDITGLEELLEIAAGRPVHVAHVNSYCRGQIEDPVAEAARAVAALSAAPAAWSESYLALVNAADAACRDGVPVSHVVQTCLRLGGYAQTEAGLLEAIAAGWALIHVEEADGIRFAAPDEGREAFAAAGTDIAVSFPVNPPAAALAVALARGPAGFAVDALASDGGTLPRNTLLAQGLGLVAAGALSPPDLVHKLSAEPARRLGLPGKGRIEVGADADLVVVDGGGPETVIAGGRVAVAGGALLEPAGGTLLCTPAGAGAATAAGVPHRVPA